ncbi:YVTN family beta-propeller protein [Propionicimonas paludicola]|uniref:YVTN family beta-propeller protein n=1 Tax=Propionicimonas paludicola TaxID=185243 RepID=A0A2A9CPG8_9ACTN|nr:restriction endonuclease [Propionicimonas paludicola]PFG16238.1 YVTN family beta-propeller protein [Propionicimonas paludicola]
MTDQEAGGTRSAPVSGVGAPTTAGLDLLRQLDWRQFEELVGAAYRAQGFTVLPTSPGADGGIDLILSRGDERIFVQCKHWKAWQVGAPIVRELFGLVVANRATRGIVVTSGTFSREAVEFARQSGTELLDGPAVLSLLATGNACLQTGATEPAPSTPPPAASSGAPACPVCLSPMLLRRARRGPQTGALFWGCVRFPGCRGTREAALGTQLPPTHRQRARRRRGQRQAALGLVAAMLGVLMLLPIGVIVLGSMVGAATTSPTRSVLPILGASPSTKAAFGIAGLGEQPLDVALDSSSKRLYTANYVSGDVSVIDIATRSVVDTIDTPGKPVSVAIGGSTLYVADRDGKKVYAISLKTKATIATFAAGHEVLDIAVDKSAGRLFISHEDGTIRTYAIASGRRLSDLKAYAGALITVDTDEHKIYANNSAGVLYSFDSRSLRQSATKYAGPGGIAVDSKRQRLYVVQGSQLREQNLMTAKSRSIDLAIDAQSVAVDPATRTAFVVDANTNAVQTVSLE